MTTTVQRTVAAVSRFADAPFDLTEVELLGRARHEVLLQIEACGVCHTDVEGRAVLPSPCIVGHQAVGVIMAVGDDVTDFAPGDRVIASYPFCGTCEACREARPYHCRRGIELIFGGTRADGSATMTAGGRPVAGAFFQQSAFATHALVPARSLVSAPDGFSSALLAALPCGVQTGAGTILHVFRPAPEDGVIVFGAGVVGLAAIMAAAASGVRDIVAVDVVDSRLALAGELGATLTINGRDADVISTLRTHSPEGVRFALDTAAIAATWEQARGCLSVGGVFGYVNVPQPEESFSVGVLPLFERFIKLHPIHTARPSRKTSSRGS